MKHLLWALKHLKTLNIKHKFLFMDAVANPTSYHSAKHKQNIKNHKMI